MTIPDSLEREFQRSQSNLSGFVPEGRHRARAVSLDLIQARTGSTGLEVCIRITEGRAKGKELKTVLWLVGGAMSRSKGSLETLGFASLSLSETVAFVDFPSLPEVWAHVEHEVSGGQARQSVTILPTQLGKATEEPREQP